MVEMVSNSRLPYNLQVFTVSEIADILRIKRAFAYRLCADGVIPCSRMGRRVVIQRCQLEGYLKKLAGETEPKEEVAEAAVG